MEAMQALNKNKNTYLKTDIDVVAIEFKQAGVVVKKKH